MDAPAGDDAPVRDERVGRDADARVGLVAEHELGRRVVRRARADGPAAVVEVELRVNLDEVHLRLPVRVELADVAPVAAPVVVLARDPVGREVVRVDRLPVRHHARQDVVPEVVLALVARRVAPRARRAASSSGRCSCPSRRGTCPGCPASSVGLDLLVEGDDPAVASASMTPKALRLALAGPG